MSGYRTRATGLLGLHGKRNGREAVLIFGDEADGAGGPPVRSRDDRPGRCGVLGRRVRFAPGAAGGPLCGGPRAARAAAAAALFGWPARRLIVVGVTGTDGKTILSHLIAHLLESSGERVGLMSTAENRAAGRPPPHRARL